MNSLHNVKPEDLDKLTEEMKLLISLQLDSIQSKTLQYHPKILSWCLKIFSKSPAAYREISNKDFLILPSERTLRYYRSKYFTKPGWNIETIAQLKENPLGDLKIVSNSSNILFILPK